MTHPMPHKCCKLLSICIVISVAASRAFAADPAEVNLLAMGDWGRNDANQRSVAAGLNRFVETSGRTFSGMLLAGDNFYVPLENVNDRKWQTMFEKLYDPAIMNFPWYPSLGNHDYQHDNYLVEQAYSKANPSSRWKFPSRWYRVDLPSPQEPLVTVLMLDSNRPLLGEASWAEEMAWLKSEVEKPRAAKWMIAVAHHPFYSNG